VAERQPSRVGLRQPFDCGFWSCGTWMLPMGTAALLLPQASVATMAIA
jgi:hypothetical protein